MKIIDVECKGNVVRFALGRYTEKYGWINPNSHVEGRSESYYGDDWNDAPYEHNAGPVYNRFVYRYAEMSFPFDTLVLEPVDMHTTKDELVARRIPCLIVVTPEALDHLELWSWATFHDVWCKIIHMSTFPEGIKLFFFGDEFEE